MATFNRDKYRATPLSTVQSAVSSAKQFDTYFGSSRGDFAPFFKNKEGVVIKRVLPAHNPGESPYVPMMTAMLECSVDEKNDDGVVIGKKMQKKKIFLATLHAGAKFDIIEEYIKRVYELAEQFQDKDERGKFLNPITGYRMGKQWVSGIRPQLEYVFYAYIEGQIYRDSLKPKQMEALNRESAELCQQNDTAAVDMFSDPSTGFPIQWSRTKDENDKTVEVLKALPLPMKMSWNEYFDKYAVPDKVLEDLEKYPSLHSLYVDSYRKRDFELALDGLKRFDEKNGYNIFAQEDFLDMVEELEAFVDQKLGDTASTKEAPKTEKPVTKKPEPVKEEPAARKVSPKKPAEPTKDEKLKVINEEFVRQYGDEYEALTEDDFGGDDELNETYNLAKNHEDLGFDLDHVPGWGGVTEPEEEPVEEEEEEPETPTPPAVDNSGTNDGDGMSALERIRRMREQRGKK